MIAAILRFSLIQRLMIGLVTLGISAAGIWSFKNLPIDAFPDISAPQVQVIIKAPGMSPTEVEQRITFPIEMEMQGIPGQTVLRSTTKYSLSVIVIDFEDDMDIYLARNLVTERLNQVWASLPADIEGGLAPITTPLGEIFMYRIIGEDYSNQELRSLQDWVIRPHLRKVEGVADVNSLGGEVRTYEVVIKPKALVKHGISIDEVEHALVKSNRNAGGDRINQNDEVLLVRTVGKLQDMDDIKNITVRTRYGEPVHVSDVAEVRVGSMTRYGAVTADGEGEVVTGLVLLRKGANSLQAVAGTKKALESLKDILPEGVSIESFYDRTDLITKAVWTVEKALGEAVVLVLLVLIIMLGDIRSALTVALVLPLSVMFTFIMMKLFDVSANLMSLGGLAIAIGILVDAAVVVVENIHTQFSKAPEGVSRLHLVYRAVMEVSSPVISGILIIVAVFLPLFSLTGLEGKMFSPLAITITFALIGSLVLSLTVIPVLASFIMRVHTGGHGEETDGRLMRVLKFFYLPVMDAALRFRKIAVTLALIALVATATLFPQIGKEFMPIMDEGSTVILLEKDPSITLEKSLEKDAPIQKAMMELPEVIGVTSRTGADELRMDPMGLNQTDNFLVTIPREEWTISLQQFQENLREKLSRFDDIDYAFSQPIDMRVSEMLTGVRSAMAIKLYGDDLAVLEQKASEIEELVKNIEGAVDVFRTDISGQKYLQIDIDQKVIAKYGIHVEDINALVETAIGGRVVTELLENNRRIGILMRYQEKDRSSPAAIEKMLVTLPNGTKVSLGHLAKVDIVDGPVQIIRESAKRQVVIQANVDGRDVVGFVDEVRSSIEGRVELPTGYYVTFGGQFENQQRAAKRLALVVPIAIVLIYFMLFTTFRSLLQAGVIILNIPFAMIGGVVSLYYSGLYLSVPASVGFITLFGVAVLNGVVMVSYFNQLRQGGMTIQESVRKGAERRLRPVLMTAMIASFGLLPLLAATGPGSELQRPLAVVVIGGLFTSTILTLILLPALYAWLEEVVENKTRRASV
ncbi:MAG: CusA/CzcA family heavy metal efflux RND transporter [Gammaproteobacteria bacterium]|nr:CusA/CzcA family heavy metal efflux RND transporter [Gammaproteobacteria bacterium]